MDGILVINKPKGPSSFYYMKKIQRKLDIKKVGHLGTLDPNASGVLVLMCGRATKLNERLSGGAKVYQSLFTYGIETDTLDPEGNVITKSEIIPTPQQIKAVLPSLVGDVEIEIPKFSAVHINGERAYDLARRGVEFQAPKKVVKVERFELLPNGWVEIECQTGTYVRSLAKLVAQKLGTVAIASEITRTRVGNFKLENAKTLEDVTLNDLIPIENFH
ncbi:MAG: tRNA pseudouridine(55) synthase TruB [Firmicutes bacterium]|nr:tRNA pseudouridine(55) synthase TruB [Bacillota bacterium]